MLEDIAILTDGTAIAEDLGIKLENVTLQMLGQAKKVVIEKENTTIINGAGRRKTSTPALPRSRRRSRKPRPTMTGRSCRSGLPNLQAGSRSFVSAGRLEIEVKERKDRVGDALHATRAAVEEGILRAVGWPCFVP